MEIRFLEDNFVFPLLFHGKEQSGGRKSPWKEAKERKQISLKKDSFDFFFIFDFFPQFLRTMIMKQKLKLL